jgi:hypothetical protein
VDCPASADVNGDIIFQVWPVSLHLRVDGVGVQGPTEEASEEQPPRKG